MNATKHVEIRCDGGRGFPLPEDYEYGHTLMPILDNEHVYATQDMLTHRVIGRVIWFDAAPKAGQRIVLRYCVKASLKDLLGDAPVADQTSEAKTDAQHTTGIAATSAETDQTEIPAIRKRLREMRRKYKREEDIEGYTLLSHLLDGQALAMSPSERKAWKTEHLNAAEPIGRDYAISKTASLVATGLFEPQPWEPMIRELFRPSIGAMDMSEGCECGHHDDGLEHWMAEAEDCYDRALERRAENDAVREQSTARIRQALQGREFVLYCCKTLQALIEHYCLLRHAQRVA